jgi:hypothetical protein
MVNGSKSNEFCQAYFQTNIKKSHKPVRRAAAAWGELASVKLVYEFVKKIVANDFEYVRISGIRSQWLELEEQRNDEL